jgi:2-polyprenyl-6-methoxyphenol hydroxylase-like FAD-dependent oxidoreductase
VPSNSTPILIVGAGPTGLAMALWLKKCGIQFRIIDQAAKPGTTSRALAVQSRTLEFYQMLGISDLLLQESLLVPELAMWRSGKKVATAKLGKLGKDLSPFPYIVFCSQDVHEAMLCRVLADLDIQVERETVLVGFSQDAEGVTAEIKGPKGAETVRASYLCGCDGAHSETRHGINSKFSGGTYQQVFFVADVVATGEMIQGSVQISISPKDFCIVMPMKAQGTVRLTGLVPPESEGKEKISYEDVAQSVALNTGLMVSNVNWFSSYHVHHRVAEKFQEGRVFLCGDAGHIHSPAGGQGMNTGIGDAVNLAWKLSNVMKGRASEVILPSYAVERMAFAHLLVQTTDTAFKAIASRSASGSFFRAYILPNLFGLLTEFPTFLKMAFRTISQIRIHYHQSPLSDGQAGGLKGGDRLPWVRFPKGDNYIVLQSLDWQIHVYGLPASFLKELGRQFDIPVHEFQWNEDAREKGLEKNAAYLVRPDGYIAVAAPAQDIVTLKNFIHKISLKRLAQKPSVK